MAPRLFFADAEGIPRQLKRICLRDAGGIARMLTRMFIRDGAGIPRLVYVAFTSAQHTYASGSGIEIVPPGATQVVIEVWGPGGTGGYGLGSVATHSAQSGPGGAAGGYCRSVYSCVGGQTLNYSVGITYEADSTVTSGSLAVTAMQANGGDEGPNGGGTASGGNEANTTGAGGGPGGTTVADGNAGAGTSGIYAGVEGSGGRGGYQEGNAGAPGESGFVSFYYTAP